MTNEEEMIFDWSIRKTFIENVVLEMDFEIQLELYKEEITEERNIETYKERKLFAVDLGESMQAGLNRVLEYELE